MTKIRSQNSSKLYSIYLFIYLLYEYTIHFVRPVVQPAAKCKQTLNDFWTLQAVTYTATVATRYHRPLIESIESWIFSISVSLPIPLGMNYTPRRSTTPWPRRSRPVGPVGRAPFNFGDRGNHVHLVPSNFCNYFH